MAAAAAAELEERPRLILEETEVLVRVEPLLYEAAMDEDEEGAAKPGAGLKEGTDGL